MVFVCRSGFRTEEQNVENRKTRCTKVNVNFYIFNEIHMLLQVHNLLLSTAHGISLTSSSHVTTTVWLSDRHLSLLSRCYSRQWQSPRRMQSCSLRQHGCPTDALPTGRPRDCPGTRLWCTNTRNTRTQTLQTLMENSHILKDKI